ncbi:hypothetical protein SK128_015634 [Halocaridina rubra]|uniref:Uncharacterized protein n=1 Tax=Halocaridina rubra TaxID=373956 RepID=A0AAN9A2I2_HALRR
MASATTLEIRQGVTSDDYLLEKIEGGDPKTTQEHVVAVDTGFYVRLRGFFNKNSKLAIVYTSFSYLGSCYSMTDLMCHNHRCIPKMLRCDGFDHCGDNSDEPATCYVGAGNKGALTPEDAAWWYQHTPNYYFPQKSSLFGGPHGWSGVLLLTSLIVMVLLIIGLISYMFRHGPDRRLLRERRIHGLHSRRGSASDDVEVIDAAADDPPLYEPPPDYDEVIKVILSGNNLKLVRRPGGVTAWVPDKLAEEGQNNGTQPKNERPLRTRHASLDLEQGMEVVLWNSNSSNAPRNGNNATIASSENESSTPLSPNVPFRMGHVRRSSLPTAPTTEAMQNNVQGHSVSVAPETIPEAPETMESPRPPIRHVHTLSSPQISIRSFNYDTSAVSTPGPSTPHLLRTSTKTRKSKKGTKKGGKRKRSSASRKPENQNIRDDSAPPSYEDAMQQNIHNEARSTTPDYMTSDMTNHINESTQTSIETTAIPETECLSPTDRVQAAREMFQKLSKGDSKSHQKNSESSFAQHLAKRPVVPVNKSKYPRGTSSGGTISRGTVKARKAMLLKAQKQKPDCECNGACSCAHFKLDSPSEETPFNGGVKSKVNYYLTIEESNKKREQDSSADELTSQQISLAPQKAIVLPETNNSTPKKRKLVRNQSAPTIGRIRDRDLEIYFSQNDEAVENTMSSPTEDMERPLITPVAESPRPVFIIPKNTVSNGEDTAPDTPSIKNRVKLYNELAKSESPPPMPLRSPSPIRSPTMGIRINQFLHTDSTESLEGDNNSKVLCMRGKKDSGCDANIKPGLVREATAKFITTLATDIRPKLHLQDSDEWNADCYTSQPIKIPYLNLTNEISSSPDMCDNDILPLPPLKREEAESIELWDSISQGKSDTNENVMQTIVSKKSPVASSGAVPKKSPGEVTTNLTKKRNVVQLREDREAVKAIPSLHDLETMCSVRDFDDASPVHDTIKNNREFTT